MNDVLQKNMKGRHVHFVGIKGTGMTAMVEILHARGAFITGSDVPEHFYTDEILSRLGIVPFTNFSKDNVTDDVCLVVYSAAYKKEENPDLIKARELNIPTLLYSEVLGEISKTCPSVGVAGVHGKTTTTGLIGTVLKAFEYPSQILAGSVITSFNNSCTLSMGDELFVAETCEYQRHFMAFCPSYIVLTSVESDHQDYYPTYEDIRNAFVDYAEKLPENGFLIYCGDDKGASEVAEIVKSRRSDINFVSYGESENSSYRISNIRNEKGKQHFTVSSADENWIEDFQIAVPGKHMIFNSTAAVAVARCLYMNNESFRNKFGGKDFSDSLKKGLLSFVGAKRRSEIIGKVNDITFIDDYAHHPTAIKTTLKGYRNFYSDGRLIVDFMSHTYSRTQALLDEFASAFESADIVILHKIYGSAREKYDGTVSGRTLFEKTKQNHPDVKYFEEVLDAKDYVLSLLRPGDVFVTMGAGDNWKLGTAVFDELKGR